MRDPENNYLEKMVKKILPYMGRFGGIFPNWKIWKNKSALKTRIWKNRITPYMGVLAPLLLPNGRYRGKGSKQDKGSQHITEKRDVVSIADATSGAKVRLLHPLATA